MTNVKRLLELTLRRAVELDAKELWFLSGVGVLVKTNKRSRTFNPEPLSGKTVRAIHEECLGLAGREGLRKFSRARYSVTFPSIGSFSCEFVSRRNTGNLRLHREPEEFKMVEPICGVSSPHSVRRRRPTSRCSGRAIRGAPLSGSVIPSSPEVSMIRIESGLIRRNVRRPARRLCLDRRRLGNNSGRRREAGQDVLPGMLAELPQLSGDGPSRPLTLPEVVAV
jgi:hypothetical protein